MSLKDTITEDMKTAMRAKDSQRLGTIRLLQAALKQREVDERITLDDAAVVAIVDKLIKQRKDSIAAFEQAARQGLVAQEAAGITVLAAYRPARLSADEVAAEVKAIVAELAAELGRAAGPGDMGKVMGVVKARLAGKAEITLPEGTQHGKTFRLRGKGIKGLRSSYPGDLYCHVQVETPVKITEHQRKLLKELDESFRKSGDRHSPNSKSWTDHVRDLFKG